MTAQEQPEWRIIAETTQASIKAKIPKEWLLPEGLVAPGQKDVSGIPAASGILSAEELDITSHDATHILQKVHNGDWSSEQVCLAFCKRAAIAHQLVNCLTEICFDEALELARAQDATFKCSGKVTGPLHGLPVSIKDHVNVAGLRSTLGYCSWAEKRPEKDALFVTALKNAGAIVFVKTTMPQTGMILETTSNLFGRTTCGFNRDLVSGGSSGGDGALVGMYGAPMGVGTDVGGSIRAPCAFNGLYGIRPSTRRLSYDGVLTSVPGARGIAAAIGPMCHSIRDAELLCKVVGDAQLWNQDPTLVPMDWAPRPSVPETLVIGVMEFDGVVMPHPPILRAMREAVEKIRVAGHEVVTVSPYDHQRAWNITYPLYYGTGGKEIKANIAASGEPMLPANSKFSGNPDLKELSVKELYNLHAEQSAYQAEYLRHWMSTAKLSKAGRPIDALLCPVNPCASYPHDYLTWWGYTSQWNLLDYPGVVIPVGFVDKTRDLKDTSYTPISEQDREHYELYDPELWHNGPISLQLVGRQFQDEKLLAVSAVIDEIVNSKTI